MTDLRSPRNLEDCPPGVWKVVEPSGVLHLMIGRPTLEEITKEMGCGLTDTINLRDEEGNLTGVVMMVDDLALSRPGNRINVLADALYQRQCDPENEHSIFGTVAIVNDEDFAPLPDETAKGAFAG